ncbi:helix-turn-helix transcriptional regulator [Dactylosporangium sp. AC04546]|uniref:helix-turn-helix transcriptional regulator n=1 Tax=Dactylosporangium sp. AC04546 TaxID=2862460 RepID=UPI001EDC9C75|nr:helix-turn-helix transcriptional regulator [Dactylosporangium sp. AC04546]WVK87323.1 helix-turn-helix transcriptional regulator [Dactylosporangium sp. AC04546]
MNTLKSGGPRLVPGGGPAKAHGGFDALLESAVSDVLVMSSGGVAGPIGAFSRIDRDNLRRGVRYRVLFPDSARLSRKLSTMSLTGAEVRTDAAVPVDAVVIDGTTALLPADRSGTERLAQVAIFRLPSVVTATTELFERIWPVAVPLTPVDLPDGSDGADGAAPTCRERELLALLCSGSTDESAAARLGISVRTVRRMVADLMNRLGARSRFQAGAKAVGRGWLMGQAS